jgi:hypothetical protein
MPGGDLKLAYRTSFMPIDDYYPRPTTTIAEPGDFIFVNELLPRVMNEHLICPGADSGPRWLRRAMPTLFVSLFIFQFSLLISFPLSVLLQALLQHLSLLYVQMNVD